MYGTFLMSVVHKCNGKVTVAQIKQVERGCHLGSWRDWSGMKIKVTKEL